MMESNECECEFFTLWGGQGAVGVSIIAGGSILQCGSLTTNAMLFYDNLSLLSTFDRS